MSDIKLSLKAGSEKLLIFRSAELLGMFSCHAFCHIAHCSGVSGVEIELLYIIQVHTYSVCSAYTVCGAEAAARARYCNAKEH